MSRCSWRATLSFLYLITPVEVLVNTAPDFGNFRVALKTLEALQLALSDRETTAANESSVPAFQTLTLDGVTHAYRSEHDDGVFQLGPIDLRFAPGEIVFITGGNGSGKTTLAKLLSGLYTADGGQVLLNGVPVVDDADRDRYRQQFSAVFSDFHLFEEILAFRGDDRRSEAVDLLHLLRLDQKVSLDGNRFSSVRDRDHHLAPGLQGRKHPGGRRPA